MGIRNDRPTESFLEANTLPPIEVKRTSDDEKKVSRKQTDQAKAKNPADSQNPDQLNVHGATNADRENASQLGAQSGIARGDEELTLDSQSKKSWKGSGAKSNDQIEGLRGKLENLGSLSGKELKELHKSAYEAYYGKENLNETHVGDNKTNGFKVKSPEKDLGAAAFYSNKEGGYVHTEEGGINPHVLLRYGNDENNYSNRKSVKLYAYDDGFHKEPKTNLVPDSSELKKMAESGIAKLQKISSTVLGDKVSESLANIAKHYVNPRIDAIGKLGYDDYLEPALEQTAEVIKNAAPIVKNAALEYNEKALKVNTALVSTAKVVSEEFSETFNNVKSFLLKQENARSNHQLDVPESPVDYKDPPEKALSEKSYLRKLDSLFRWKWKSHDNAQPN